MILLIYMLIVNYIKFPLNYVKKIVEGFFWGFLTNMMKIKGGCWSQ